MSNNSTVHLAPQIVTQQESAAHIAALEAENARLRTGLVTLRANDYHTLDCNTRYGADRPCDCEFADYHAAIDALLGGPDGG